MTGDKRRRERLEDKLRRLRDLPPERTPHHVSPPFVATPPTESTDQE